MFFKPSKIFLLCLIFFVLGVGVVSFIDVDFVVLYLVFLILIVFLIIFWQKKNYKTIALFGVFFILGALRLEFSKPNFENPKYLAHYNGQEVTVEGFIVQEPDIRLDHQKLTISVKYLNTQNKSENHESFYEKSKEAKGRLLIKTGLYPEYKYGDLLRIFCQIQEPEPIENFSYDKYLARYDIYSVCWRGRIEKIDSNQGNKIMSVIFFIKLKFMDSVNRIISEPYAAFLSGLLVGARRGIPDYLLEAFNRTGTTHIIAISGSNITIIAAVIIGFMQFLGISRKRSFWWISFGILIFVIMTGATASVVRAGIMGIFVLLAKQLGRSSRATNALVFTAFIMLVVNPKILMFDAGFQLSFLATVGLVYINPIIQKYFENFSELFGLKEALITTLSAMVTTTPLILYQFGRLSIVAPVANVLILPIIPATMAIGFIAGFFGIFSQFIGEAFAWPAWILLEYMVRVSETLSSWKFASIDLGSFHWILMLAFYSVIFWVVWVFRYKNKIS